MAKMPVVEVNVKDFDAVKSLLAAVRVLLEACAAHVGELPAEVRTAALHVSPRFYELWENDNADH